MTKGKRELERKQGEVEREGGRGGGEEGAGETQRFSHVQTEGFEAFDPDPQTRVHLTKQVRLVFQAVS